MINFLCRNKEDVKILTPKLALTDLITKKQVLLQAKIKLNETAVKSLSFSSYIGSYIIKTTFMKTAYGFVFILLAIKLLSYCMFFVIYE